MFKDIKNSWFVMMAVVLTVLAGCSPKHDEAKSGHEDAKEELGKARLNKSDLPTPSIIPGKLLANNKNKKEGLPDLIREGRRMLDELPTLLYDEVVTVTKEKNKKGKVILKNKKEINYDIVFAVANMNTKEIETISVNRAQAKKATTVRVSGGNFLFSYSTWNGCNTPFDIKRPSGYVVLALRCIIGNGKNVESLVYTPYTEDINTNEMREIGYTYLVSRVEEAKSMLAHLGVKSRAFPKEMVSDVVPMSVAFRLALVEHIEPSLIEKIPPEVLVNKVLVTVAANQEVAYMTSKSKAGAYGQFQFMPKTYSRIVAKYPQAKLKQDFRDGMRDHLNAAKASMLLLDADWSQVKRPRRDHLRENPDDLALYLAAAYNTGSGRVAKAIKNHGEAWKDNLLPETVVYLKKLERVNGTFR